MIKAGIIGGTGYTAGELIRILVFHPDIEIDFIYSTSSPGRSVTEIHGDLVGDISLNFSGKINPDVDVLFLCLGHGLSRSFLEEHTFSSETKVVDLSRDFRLNEQSGFSQREFTYGLPEVNRDKIARASNIANPGCYATAIQLALLPLAKNNSLQNDVHIHGITGSTGAGQNPSETTHFSWRNSNVSLYKAFTHQHVDEIKQTLHSLQPESEPDIHFLPVRGNFTRGIFCSAYLDSELSEDEAFELYHEFYANHPYTHLTQKAIDLKQVVGTNKCLLHVEKHEHKLLITSIIDNLLKGASGQAVQNFNLMFGLEETAGLHLKSTRF